MLSRGSIEAGLSLLHAVEGRRVIVGTLAMAVEGFWRYLGGEWGLGGKVLFSKSDVSNVEQNL